MANHLEIWAKDRWESLEEQQSDLFEDMAEELSDIMG
jgi:MraZ protein